VIFYVKQDGSITIVGNVALWAIQRKIVSKEYIRL